MSFFEAVTRSSFNEERHLANTDSAKFQGKFLYVTKILMAGKIIVIRFSSPTSGGNEYCKLKPRVHTNKYGYKHDEALIKK